VEHRGPAEPARLSADGMLTDWYRVSSADGSAVGCTDGAVGFTVGCFDAKTGVDPALRYRTQDS